MSVYPDYFWPLILVPDIKEALSVNILLLLYPSLSSRILKMIYQPCWVVWELSKILNVEEIWQALFAFAKESFVKVLPWKLKKQNRKVKLL